MLFVKDFSLTMGSKILLEDASLQLNAGMRCGLIGRNGTGKTSLLQVLLGNITPQKGEIEITPGWRVGYLAQELPESTDKIIDYCCQGDEEWATLQDQLLIAEAKEDGVKIGAIHERLANIDGYRVEQRAARILVGLGFDTEQQQQSVQDFSGGWQMRLQLARVLMMRADLLLLDEPTNHLDLESIIWLESWLQNYTGTALIISHDRDFLDTTTTHSVHLFQHNFKIYQGNYSSFAKQWMESLMLQQKMNDKIVKKQQHMQSFVDRFRAKASKAKQAQSRLKALEKLQTCSSIEGETGFSFSFLPCEEVSYPALSIEGVLGYGEKVIVPWCEMQVGYGERIGIVGRNGSGKTTLLRSLCGQIPLINGIVNSHPKLKIGYFSQRQLEILDPSCSAYEHLREVAPEKSEAELRGYLGRFAFSRERVFENIKNFSGGEKARLALALLILQGPNVLILDEPTNHLDMVMREALIMALQRYEGVVLLVSHDRYLLKACVDELILVNDGKIDKFKGDCDDYHDVVLSLCADNSTSKKSSAEPAARKPNQKKLKKAEKQVALLQKQIAKIDEQLSDPEMHKPENTAQLAELNEKRSQLSSNLEKAEASWLEIMGGNS